MARKLDNWIEAYLKYTDNTEPPRVYREWTALSVIAAALERKCYLNWGHITFYPNMYIVLVGPSGKCRKGTAMGVGASMLREIGIEMAAEAITREALIRELDKAAKTETDPETGDMMFHSSLTVFSQELTVFLGYNNVQLMSDITDWYDCRDRWTYRTKGSGTDDITGVWVNLIGATTPDLIKSTLPQDAIGGGLSSRIVFVYADEKGKVVPDPFLTDEDQRLYEDLVSDLEQIHMMKGSYNFTDEFMAKYSAWYTHQEKNPPFYHPNFSGYVNRRQNHIIKMSMIISASQREDMLMTGDIFNEALGMLTEVEQKMPEVFKGYGKSDNSDIITTILRTVAMEKKISKKEIMQRHYQDINTMEHLSELISMMVQLNWIKYDVNKQMLIHTPKEYDKSLG